MPAEDPFTVVVCRGCPTTAGQTPAAEVLDAVGGAIRECHHGVLIAVPCLLGPAFCANRPGCGVLAAIQPCTVDRVPAGPARLLGPIREWADVAEFCRWLQAGRWAQVAGPLFRRLRRPAEPVGHSLSGGVILERFHLPPPAGNSQQHR